LADYTAIGLPVLVWGRDYSSAARWATENPGAAILITAPEPALVCEAVLRVMTDSRYALRLAAAAIEAGNRYFELAAAREIFLKAIGPTQTGVELDETSVHTFQGHR
jgi:hypothetical protein